MVRHIRRQSHIHKILLHPEHTAVFQGHSLQEIPSLPCLFQKADGAAGICPLLPLGLFQLVQLLKHHHGQYHLVVLKTIQRPGILNQHIGIDHVCFYHPIFLLLK